MPVKEVLEKLTYELEEIRALKFVDATLVPLLTSKEATDKVKTKALSTIETLLINFSARVDSIISSLKYEIEREKDREEEKASSRVFAYKTVLLLDEAVEEGTKGWKVATHTPDGYLLVKKFNCLYDLEEAKEDDSDIL